MANLSKIKREKMLKYLEKLKEINNDDENIRAITELENALNDKKYGLVWEEHSEKVDEMLEHNVPIFVENRERKITANENEAYNFLLEGDNLHSLKLLEKTHKGKIDVIYIDPPYNTGNKDFIYDDSFVDKTDGYAHSKWLSFMEKRLVIARELLSSDGVIFISIDDNEQAQLKLLCDSIFGEDNFIGNFKWIRKKKGSFLNNKIRKMTEFVLCYSSLGSGFKFFGEQAYVNKYQPIVKRTNNLHRLVFPKNVVTTKLKDGKYIAGKYVKGNTGVEFLNDFEVVNGIIINELLTNARFVWSQEFLDNEVELGTKIELSSKYGFNVLRYNQLDKYKTPSSLISSDNGVGTNEDASKELSDILGIELEDSFTNPKPVSLIAYLLNMLKKLGGHLVILDFFAGSGTTGQAVIQLNKEDGGHRKYILCTNNENNICEEVTYQRLKNIQEDLPHNLKYYKTEFIPKFSDEEDSISNKMMQHIKELIELEYHIELDGKKYLILEDEDKLTEAIEKIENDGRLFVRSGIFLSRSDQRILEEKGVIIIEIPEYYFREELKEVGEL